jgi:hypothetical protein
MPPTRQDTFATRMGGSMDNEAIAARFLEAKAVDFDAIGDLVTKLGPELAVSRVGPKMVLIGRPFIVACMLTARESAGLVGQFQQAELGREVLGE